MRKYKLRKFYFYTHLLNEYAKEEEEEEKKKNKTTDWPTFHRVLLRKCGEYLFNISLTYQMIVSGLVNALCFCIRKFFTASFR